MEKERKKSYFLVCAYKNIAAQMTTNNLMPQNVSMFDMRRKRTFIDTLKTIENEKHFGSHVMGRVFVHFEFRF